MPDVRLISGPKSWIEGEAVRQLENVASLPGVIEAIGMPDLHPGQGCPVGAVFVTKGRIYPHLIGTDVGCGMNLWGTTVKPVKPDRIAKKLKSSLERGIDDPIAHLGHVGPCGFESTLGTVGRGNHFAELLAIDEIREPDHIGTLNDFNSLLLVHSGSRGYGEQILFEHTAAFQGEGLSADSEEAALYIRKHDHAVQWAYMNRRVIASRILESLGAQGSDILDSVHNFLDFGGRDSDNEPIWIHRKGAIPSNEPLVVIPGSRGAHTYVVRPIGDQKVNRESVAHGAGRKMSRRDARVKFDAQQDSIQKLERTKFGSAVICEDRTLLMEEAPEVYKSIDRVVQDLVDHELVSVVALLKPVVTYKMRRTGEADGDHQRTTRRD